MAFDQPLAADSIDEFNLLSAFVRAPLWLLGGVLGTRSSSPGGGDDGDEEDEESVSMKLQRDDQENEKPAVSKRIVSYCDDESSNDAATDCKSSLSPRSSYTNDLREGIHKTYACREASLSDMLPGLRRPSRLSWSDDSGRSLVEYNDESVQHDANPYASATSSPVVVKPMKSAMKRTSSVRCVAGSLSSSTQSNTSEKSSSTRYIPNMARKERGLMPVHPHSSNGSGDPSIGPESPQWGWYTRLTPPTPEMYQRHPSKGSTSLSSKSPTTTDRRSCQNSVFQSLQNSKAPVGWTSVPI